MLKLFKKILFLSLILIVTLLCMGTIFNEYRRGYSVWDGFYEQPEKTLDVIFVGSSLSYSSFNPLIFNGYLGVNSYNLGTASQNVKQTYFNLLEIVKYQSPKLIVFEAYSLDIPDLSDSDRIGFKYENLDKQKFSITKLNSINVQFSNISNKINALFPIVRNHNNWSDISLIQKNIEGFELDRYLGYKREYDRVKIKNLKSKLDDLPVNHSITNENIRYFESLVSLCNYHHIKIIVVRAPVLYYKYNKSEYYKEVFTNTKELCDRLGVDYIDYNSEWDEFNFDNSFYYDGLHLNYKGSVKVSEKLCQDLENMNISLGRDDFKVDEPEDFIYSENKSNVGNVLYSGNFEIEQGIEIDEIRFVENGINEYSVIVSFSKANYDLLSNLSLGIYMYPVQSQQNLLVSDIDIKRKYTSIGFDATPGQFKDKFYLGYKFDDLNITDFRKIRFGLYNKKGVYGNHLVIKNVKL